MGERAVSELEVGIVGVGLLIAGLVKGLTGIGYSTCALPFLVAAIGLERSLAVVIMPAIACNLALVVSSGSFVGALRRFWRFYVSIIPGTVLGVGLLVIADPRVAVGILGFVTIIYSGLVLGRLDMSLSPVLERRLAVPLGLANGVLTGFTGSQIMPLMPYIMALRLSADEQVQAVNVAVILASTVLALALMTTGRMSWEALSWSAFACAPAILGVHLGGWVRAWLPWQLFRLVTLVMLAILGFALLLQASRLPAGSRCDPNGSVPVSAIGEDCPGAVHRRAE